MKKQILYLFLALVTGLFFMVPFTLGKVTIKVGHIERGNRHESCLQAFAATFKDIVESQSGGEMEVIIYPGAQLGNMREMVESTRMGVIQATFCFTSVASTFSPIAELPMAPFIFPTAVHAWHAIDGWFGKELAEAILMESKLRVLAHGETNGFRNLWNAKRPIRKVGDLKGLRIRVPESKMLVTLFSSLGASPVVVPIGETYTSMQTGLIDGFDFEASGIVDQKFVETIKYGTLTNHGYTSNYMLANDDWFKKLSSKNKEIVMDAARIGAVVCRGVSQNNHSNSISLMRSSGVAIYAPPKEELGDFIKLGQPPCLSYLEKINGKEWVRKLLRASREANEALALK